MADYLTEYVPLAIFFVLSLAMGIMLMLSALIIAVRNPDKEKNSPYECGFEPFDDARTKFDIRFYLVAILFLIFDLEVAFLFPWAIGFQNIGSLGFWSMMLFLLILTIGFIYEWKKGALEWD
jgi:NADH-quinone oxidoreductase subunit A